MSSATYSSDHLLAFALPLANDLWSLRLLRQSGLKHAFLDAFDHN